MKSMSKLNYKLNPKHKRGADWVHEFRTRILSWYDANGRDLPWRYKNGAAANPYFVWLSEVMLQQTTVGAVKSYFEAFTTRWPSVHDLAAADTDDVMAAWAGLGYYARARNLHKCAKVVAHELGGVFPSDEAALLKLPGVGAYTAAAVRAIAFNKPAVVVDGNIERICARVFAVSDPVPKAKPYLKILAAQVFDGEYDRHGDFAQSLMDVGSSVCIAKTPRCGLCPVSDMCAGLKEGAPHIYPVRTPKKKTPQKRGVAYWLTNDAGQVLLERRADDGLLGGMLGLPTSEWIDSAASTRAGHLKWVNPETLSRKASVRHVFTHFGLDLEVMCGVYNGNIPQDGYFWQKIAAVNARDFPTVFKKCLDKIT